MPPRLSLLLVPALWSGLAGAQNLLELPERFSTVTLTASATAAVDNDRMDVLLVARAENKSAAAAAGEVNTKMQKALAQAKATSGVTAKTVGYSTEPVYEKQESKPRGWRVIQQLQIEATDFANAAALATKLQEDGLLLSNLSFHVAPETRRKALAKLQHEALTQWKEAAKDAAASLDLPGYRIGHLMINTGGEIPQPRPMMARMQADAMPTVAVAGGNSDLTVTVSGNAVLAGPRR